MSPLRKKTDGPLHKYYRFRLPVSGLAGGLFEIALLGLDGWKLWFLLGTAVPALCLIFYLLGSWLDEKTFEQFKIGRQQKQVIIL